MINPHPASLDDVLAAATAYGYKVRKVPMAEWEAGSTRAADLDARSSVLPYLLLLPEHNMETVRGLSRMPVYDCANVTAGLAGSGIECPRVESATLQRCFERFVQTGEWPAPLETPTCRTTKLNRRKQRPG